VILQKYFGYDDLVLKKYFLFINVKKCVLLKNWTHRKKKKNLN